MAIRMVYGVPGSGKSFFTTQKIILPALKKGRKVITNVSLDRVYLEEILEIDPDLIEIVESEKGDFSDTFLNVEDYQDDWRDEKGRAPLIVVDEAHFALNKQRKKSEVIELENFYSTHRQAGYDIYLITQDYNRIPRDILGFVEIYYEVMKQKNLGSNIFTYYVRNSDRKIVGQKTGMYEKEIFKCYKSHLLSDGEVEEELDAVGIKLVWFSPWYIALAAVVVIAIVGFGFFGWSINPFAFLNKEEESSLKDGVKIEEIEFEQVSRIEEPLTSEVVLDDIQLSQDVMVIEKPVEPEIIKYLKQDHPLDGKLFQIRNWIGDSARIAIFDKETREMVSSINSDDLERMGYVVDVFSDCAMKLTYENINFFIDCSRIQKVEESTSDRVLGNIPNI